MDIKVDPNQDPDLVTFTVKYIRGTRIIGIEEATP